MSTPHLTVAEIAEVLASPSDDVRRRHLDECVRCRLLLSRYESFVAAPEHVPLRDLADAEARLATFLERRTGAIPSPGRAQPARPAKDPGRLTRWPGGPGWQPAFALAVVVVLGAGGLWIATERTHRAPGPTRVLRGGAAASTLHVATAMPLGDGGLSLHWTAVAGADEYELHFYSPELRELGSPARTADTTFSLGAGALPGAVGGDTLLVSIAAMHGEALLARSAPQPIVLPPAPGMR
jgi:hypothetical protein